MRQLTVVIPLRQGGSPEVTLRTLARQTFQDFDVIISQDEHDNANWARNQGFAFVHSPLVLFSDDDIQWEPEAFATLLRPLTNGSGFSYSYGAYWIGGHLQCNRVWDAAKLRKQNYISTMSVIRSADFPGFDETVPRLQDWDLWLTMLERGKVGVYCGNTIFTTERRNGITYNGPISWTEAERRVRQKHRLGG